MTLLETLLLITISIGLTLHRFLKKYEHFSTKKVYWGILIITFIIHIFIDGSRWTMLPAYCFGLLAGYLVYLPDKDRGSLKQVLKYLGLIIMVVVMWLLPKLFPVFSLPKPMGNEKIGTEWLYLKDESRAETITAYPYDHRELMVKIWYPAAVKDENKESYMDHYERRGMSRKYHLPAWMLNHLDKVETHAYHKPRVKKGKHPILMFSHGLNVPPTIYYAFLENLVSHGYIVVQMNHTYESTATLFPDGEQVFYNDSFNIASHTPEMGKLTWELSDDFMKAKTHVEKLSIARTMVHNYVASETVRRWSKDVSFVMDQLKKMNRDIKSPYYARLDFNKVGAFGHSMGGAAAGQALINDKRIKAAMNWDGTQWGGVIDTAFQQPFMALQAYRDSSVFEPNPVIYHLKGSADFYDVRIHGAGHSNFMDIPYWIPIRYINQAGPIQQDRLVEITNRLTLTFFDKYLKREPVAMTGALQEYPEVSIAYYEKEKQAKVTYTGDSIVSPK